MTTNVLRLLVLAGDGIGPEITAATLTVLQAAERAFGLSLAFEHAAVGWAAHRAQGTTLPGDIVDKARAAHGVLLGPVSHNDYPPAAQGGRNPSGELRKALDLYANIRPARSRPGLPPRCGKPVDLVIVRENTEGFYADRNMHLGSGEFMPTPDLALSVRKVTREGSTRIVEAAFALAMQRRKKVTAVHKANVLHVTEGLFLECVQAVAARYPQVLTKSASSTPWRRSWCATPAHSTWWSPPICTAISSPTRPRRFPAAWAWQNRSMPAASMPWRRPSTVRRPTSPAATWPIRRR